MHKKDYETKQHLMKVYSKQQATLNAHHLPPESRHMPDTLERWILYTFLQTYDNNPSPKLGHMHNEITYPLWTYTMNISTFLGSKRNQWNFHATIIEISYLGTF
ncbi:unnamed protein product [Rhizophagus irregularis]|nr:unnamed protein product [Rhizophagus irregularis]CAB5390761.1 unnamed protein product [Rhizophagus irregularis]